MRDPLYVPFNDQVLIIATDNSGGIGMKEKDLVKVPYHVVSYYSFRVAVMECMAAGGFPVSIVMQNFCGESVWEELKEGIQEGLDELGLDIPITGSTETNMELLQSALGLSVLGTGGKSASTEALPLQEANLAVIGKPLVGAEVVEESRSIAPLQLFKQLWQNERVTILPVGSKGIADELCRFLPGIKIENIENIGIKLDLHKSAGPSTCFIISYPADLEQEIQEISGNFFNKITLSGH
ncbi:ATP-binding protein [Bacillus sp. CECT 9360]|uniref:ATP-binding protein n=1 Tax=Bacillus sp. CECT 9360 TaxID=2845821 RepID=UPI001E5E4995|nr:ATP-binding protein [Bacillus sp. CECT 9360]CAH0345001.1 hypothetical protein BCI9360_01277 [Bacillus sp. CECT 9360]